MTPRKEPPRLMREADEPGAATIRVYTRAEYAESLRECLKKSLREL